MKSLINDKTSVSSIVKERDPVSSIVKEKDSVSPQKPGSARALLSASVPASLAGNVFSQEEKHKDDGRAEAGSSTPSSGK